VWNNPITYIGGSFGGPTYTYYGNHTTLGGNYPTNYSSNVSFTSSSNAGGVNFNTTSMNNTFAGPNIRSKRGILKSKPNSRSEVTMDMLSMDSLETGRVEKGGSSDQSFKTVDKTFNYFTCATSIWKILPVSQKVFEKQDLKVYCGNCGTKKRRDSHLFCPHCGEKY
jgi:hypothetical protein